MYTQNATNSHANIKSLPRLRSNSLSICFSEICLTPGIHAAFLRVDEI